MTDFAGAWYTTQSVSISSAEDPNPHCILRDETEPCETCAARGNVWPRPVRNVVGGETPPTGPVGWFEAVEHTHPAAGRCVVSWRPHTAERCRSAASTPTAGAAP